MSRRYRTNHPNVRSTTHRRGWTLNPSAAFRVIVTAHRHTRRTNSTNRLLKALSAITSRTRGRSRRAAPSSQHPPSRSCTSAVRTDSAQTRPSESTPMNRLRPLTFFPPVEPAGAAPVGRLDRLAVHPQRLGRRRVPGLGADLGAEAGVDRLPDPGQPPQPEPGVDRLPRREVVRQHPPRLPA